MRERSGLERELRELGLREYTSQLEFENPLTRLWREGKEKLGATASALATLVTGKRVLATTKCGRPVLAYVFPGSTDRRALVIGGVHGSELSGVEATERLVSSLQSGPQPFFSVVVIPRLFPDNVAVAESSPGEIGSGNNVGRKTSTSRVDPNRQFPPLGKAFDPGTKKDAKGRIIERENVALLTLIADFKPERIASIHAIRQMEDAGIYADPRTNPSGVALGHAPDANLAIAMAKHARARGANVPGNKLDTAHPTARYPKDKAIVQPGKFQPRETTEGTSLGGWGSTEIVDSRRPAQSRPAMTVITVEVQTAKRIEDFGSDVEKRARTAEIDAHVSSLREVFLSSPGPSGP